MQVKVHTNYIHIAPRKTRLVANLIKNLDVNEAEKQLLFSKKLAARVVAKSLKSAVASALHNFSLEKNNLYISQILVNEGPSMKRWSPAAFGSAHSIKKQTSHLTIILDEKVKSKKKTAKKEEKKIEEKTIIAGKDEKTLKEKKPFFDKKGIKKIHLKQQKRGFASKIFSRKSG